MAWEYRKNCVDCGIERVIVVSAQTEDEAISIADNEWVKGMCAKCREAFDVAEMAKLSTEELFADVLAVLR